MTEIKTRSRDGAKRNSDAQLMGIIKAMGFGLLLLLAAIVFNWDKIKNSTLGKSVGAIASISMTVQEKYNHKSVYVHINNNTYISVNLLNSRFSSATEDEKAKVATEIANLVAEKYPTELERIIIIYGKHEVKYGVDYNDNTDSYRFKEDPQLETWILE